MFERILKEFEISGAPVIKPFGSGLINNTWHITVDYKEYILQRINQNVFKNPPDIAENIKLICEYLKTYHPDYKFICPCKTRSKDELIYIQDEGYFRLFPYIKNSHTIDVVKTTSQAKEAAMNFGKFTKVLASFPVDKLKITLPDFHDLTLRYHQFESALKNGNNERKNEAVKTIDFLKAHNDIVLTNEKLSQHKDFRKRVTHHDCKISNVLLDENDSGICVIDLDTVMPGYFISDAGDMMRTFLSPYSEEEKDLDKIEIRDEYFKAIADGYLGEMGNELTEVEKAHFVYAGKFMMYMQALRFLTDHLNNDAYYGSKYEGHNLVRANNQVTLLKKFMEKEKMFEEFIRK